MLARRHLILYGSLILTLIAVMLVDRDIDQEVVLAERTPIAGSATIHDTFQAQSVSDPDHSSGFKRAEYVRTSKDLFRPQIPVDQSPSSNSLPTAQSAPATVAFPFEYMGQQHTTDGVLLFLLYQERTLTVRAGNIIDNTYKVKKITPQSVEFIHLPSKQQQILDLGSTSQ